MITSEQIEEIRQRSDVVRVIGKAVQLRKQGHRFVGCCPFHQEKTPSFSIDPDKKVFYCFGCQAGGDVFSFVMQYDGLDFLGAARVLAREAGVLLEPETPQQVQMRQTQAIIVQVNQAAHTFFQAALQNHLKVAQPSHVREYVCTTRRLPLSLVTERQLGYGGQPGKLLRYLQSKGFTLEQCKLAGLLTEDKTRSLFDERVIFPVLNAQGQLAGFGGRILHQSDAPKYMNSRDSVLFSKKALLYGFYEAQPSIRVKKQIIVAEGYFDVLAMLQAHCPNAVAALGTAITSEHAEQCHRLAQEVILLLDGDAAGQRATAKAIPHFMKVGMRVLLGVLPVGHDPDSLLLERGAAVLKQVVAQATPAIEYFFTQAFSKTSMSVEHKVQAAQHIATLIQALPQGLEKELYWAKLSTHVGLPLEQLQKYLAASTRSQEPEHVNKNIQKQVSPAEHIEKTKNVLPTSADKVGLVAAEIEILKQLLLFPSLKHRWGELSEFAITDGMKRILETLHEQSSITSDVWAGFEFLSPQLKMRFSALKPLSDAAPDEVALKAEQTFEDALRKLKILHIDVALKDVIQQIQICERQGEATEELLRRKQMLTARKGDLRRLKRFDMSAT